MSNIVDTLSAVEKALGLTPVEVPENWEDFVQEEEFTASSFIQFIKEEVASQRSMDAETLALHKEYLGEMISLAKFTFDQKDKPNQIKIPRARNFGPMAMKVWRAFQNAARPKMGGMSFKKSEEQPELAEGEILTKSSLEDLAKALAPALIKLLEGELDTKETTEEVAKESDEGANIEAVQTGDVDESGPEVEEVTTEVEKATDKPAAMGAVEDIVLDEQPDLGKLDTWSI